jgi:hypothetical protein
LLSVALGAHETQPYRANIDEIVGCGHFHLARKRKRYTTPAGYNYMVIPPQGFRQYPVILMVLEPHHVNELGDSGLVFA